MELEFRSEVSAYADDVSNLDDRVNSIWIRASGKSKINAYNSVSLRPGTWRGRSMSLNGVFGRWTYASVKRLEYCFVLDRNCDKRMNGLASIIQI